MVAFLHRTLEQNPTVNQVYTLHHKFTWCKCSPLYSHTIWTIMGGHCSQPWFFCAWFWQLCHNLLLSIQIVAVSDYEFHYKIIVFWSWFWWTWFKITSISLSLSFAISAISFIYFNFFASVTVFSWVSQPCKKGFLNAWYELCPHRKPAQNCCNLDLGWILVTYTEQSCE